MSLKASKVNKKAIYEKRKRNKKSSKYNASIPIYKNKTGVHKVGLMSYGDAS